MAKKSNTVKVLRREIKDIDRKLLQRMHEFAAMREQRDELFSDLQDRCPHKNIVHFRGRQVEDHDEPFALDLRPARRLCLDCGITETGCIPDEQTLAITQRIASTFTSSANVIDTHTHFLILTAEPILFKCESEADDYDLYSLVQLESWKRKIKASLKE